jgi:lysophospholipase L1-like esterase
VSRRFGSFPGWVTLSFGISGLLLASALLLHRSDLAGFSQVNASTAQVGTTRALSSSKPGQRRQLTYEQWVALLRQEAKVAAESHPKQLMVLAGDSLSLWFPPELLPSGNVWLNQGISGETSIGLLRRLKLFDQTQPETIFVMIGINDLIRGFSAETLLANYREIVQHLKRAHPQARIVVQSLLPHAGSRLLRSRQSLTHNTALKEDPAVPWVPHLAIVSNDSIRQLNQALASMARDEGVDYMDLHSYFTDAKGDLSAPLSTDGLHLSAKGYQVWRSRLQAFAQPTATETRSR